MSMILPYEKRLENVEAAYIKPYGDIEYVFSHDEYAREYCLGTHYKEFYDIKNGKYAHIDDEEFLLEELTNTYHYPDNINSISEINEYINTKLSKKELELLKKYEYSKYFYYTYSDFLVSILHFDKVQDLCGKRIITSSSEPHIRFYNYYLMDWEIEKIPSLYWNTKTNSIQEEKYSILGREDNIYEREINDIKRKVLSKKDRQLFFK